MTKHHSRLSRAASHIESYLSLGRTSVSEFTSRRIEEELAVVAEECVKNSSGHIRRCCWHLSALFSSLVISASSSPEQPLQLAPEAPTSSTGRASASMDIQAQETVLRPEDTQTVSCGQQQMFMSVHLSISVNLLWLAQFNLTELISTMAEILLRASCRSDHQQHRLQHRT